MKKQDFKKHFPLFITVIVDILLVTAVIVLMNYVQNRLNIDAETSLIEIVTQNKNVINSKLNTEINNLRREAQQIAKNLKNNPLNTDNILQVIEEEHYENSEINAYIASSDGMAFFENGELRDISGRNYFKLTINGKDNISERIVSRVSGAEIFVISVPILYNENILGTIHKAYSPEEMYEICSVSLFSEQGSMYIINSQGYILINSQNKTYSQESENLFSMLSDQGNKDAACQLEEDVKNNQSGFMETFINRKKTFSAYTPIEEVYDWYLVSSVATGAVSANAILVIRLFYCILIALVLVFACSMLYFLSYKNKQQENLKHIAFVDSVTGGNTLTKFSIDLQRLLAEYPEKQFYVLKFDINNFKYVNNFYGFDVGNQVLHYINKTIKGQLREFETIARISSDHFVLLLEDAHMDRLVRMHNSIQNKEEITLYFSAGLYKITDPTESINLMLDKASMAAQTIKENMYEIVAVYTEDFDQGMIHNEQLKQAVKKGLKADEFMPFFQPKVNVFTGKLFGAEALARWRTSDGKFISPGEFIPLCEKTGLVVELDMIIFEKVLRFLKTSLRQKESPVPISVNFSRLHLNDNNFIDKIMEKIEFYGVPPQLIEIELTESVIFDHHDSIATFITRLHEKGLLISMDDFGSGYSSLNMLKDFPIDVLKIDKVFLNEAGDNVKRNIIFSAIAQMARQLNISIVVEGVETIEHVELMKNFGCDIAQGYYYAKPMDEQSFERIYRAGGVCFSHEETCSI